MIRENLERIVGIDDSAFSGLDLATLIRNKYGRSYDVQLIKKVCVKLPTLLKVQACRIWFNMNIMLLNILSHVQPHTRTWKVK